jgi:hypothetical protein
MVSHCACPTRASEAARSASTGDQQALFPPLLQTYTKGSGRGCPSLRASSDRHPLNDPPRSLASLSWNGTRVGPTAAVERAHSDRARSGSKRSARVSFQSFVIVGALRARRAPGNSLSPSWQGKRGRSCRPAYWGSRFSRSA